MLNKNNTLFLEALKASLTGSSVNWTEEIVSQANLTDLFQMAAVHQVLPMIFESVYVCEAFSAVSPQMTRMLRQNVMRQVSVQTIKTDLFRNLFSSLLEAGVRPCVVKGVICRGLYPKPDTRISGDEDVLIRSEDYLLVDKLLRNAGLQVADPAIDPKQAYEIPYIQKNGPLYIELHKQLFPPESEAYGNMNAFFEDVLNRLTEIAVDGGKYLTMHPTDHLLYLICHSFKHFLHSGFGIRQVCDIILFANAYGAEVDWSYILKSCREIRADLFAAAMFRIGERYLVFDPEKACQSEEWRRIQVNETGMLEDLLESGVFGDADMSRKHSSNITLNAVIAEKRGRKVNSGIAGSIFLPRSSMEKRFPYVKRFPFLLPAAWVHRIVLYNREKGRNSVGNSAADSIRIGKHRVELLREYGIIK